MDAGCGDGLFTKLVAKKIGAKEVHGVDVNLSLLEKAKKKGITVHVCDLNKDRLPFSENFFELVTALEVIEHLVNPDHMLLEVYRVIKPGGFFVLSTPNLASWINRLFLLIGYQLPVVEPSNKIWPRQSTKWHPHGPVGHLRAYTKSALSELLGYYGFEILRFEGARTSGKMPKPLGAIDKMFSKIPSLARCIIVTNRKPPKVFGLET